MTGRAVCSAPVSNPLSYNYSRLRERVICEALTPFLPQMVQIPCSAASADDERGLDLVPTVNDVLRWVAEKDSKCFSELILASEGLWGGISAFSFIGEGTLPLTWICNLKFSPPHQLKRECGSRSGVWLADIPPDPNELYCGLFLII